MKVGPVPLRFPTCVVSPNEPNVFVREYINQRVENGTSTLHPIWSQSDMAPQPNDPSVKPTNFPRSWKQTDPKQSGGAGSEYVYDGYIRAKIRGRT
jgi:hypothetical protein